MKIDSNTVILIVITLLAAFGAYWYFFSESGNEPPLTATVAENEAQMQFQILASELQPIAFDTSIFSDPRFVALVDLATPVAPESVGRLDPFSPLSGISEK